MDHRQLHSRSWNLVLALGCVAAFSGFACGGSEKKQDGSGGAGGSGGGSGGSGGSGGAGGSGGTSSKGGSGGNAGSGGSGGVTSGGSGGNAGSGGAGGSGGANSGGSGGSSEGGAGGGNGGGGGSGGSGGAGGGTTIPPTACGSNDDCSASGGMCETILKICVQCLKSSDCSDGSHCLGNKCLGFASCVNSRDCSTDQVCDPNRGVCVECAAQGDCGDNQACVFNKCVSTAGCESNDNCDGKLCDTTAKRCVDCLGDEDCGADSGKKCIAGACRTSCTSDKQCTPQGMLCDTATSGCVQCKANADCPASMYCEGGACKADICDSTQSTCSNNGIAACNEAGNGWATPKSCGKTGCQASGGVATCDGQPPVDGGAGPDGNPEIDGGGQQDAPIGCTTEKGNPCTGIPKYLGTQVVDGKDDDMCQIPAFTFNKAAAGAVNNYNNIQDSEFPVITARVAWSSAGFHGFFDVVDASLQSVAMKDPGAAVQKPYQGDSIELFFSSNDNATGAPGGDNGAVHITLGATGPSVAVKVTNSGGIQTTYTELAAAQYKTVTTTTGWAIEVLIPWQGGAPAGGGKARFDMAVNVADTNCSGVDDMRDAQAVLNQGTVSGQTSCPGGAEPWCDDRTWCSTTLAQ